MSLEAVALFRSLHRWADLTHFHFPWPFADILYLLGKKTHSSSILTYHSDIVKQKRLATLYRPLMNWFLSEMQVIVCTSPNYLQSSSALARFREKSEVIPIGLDRSTYPAPTLDRGPVKPFFFFVGVLRYYKGLDTLIKAAKGAPYEVLIAGTGPLENELRQKALKQHASNVRFLGRISDQEKVDYIATCTALVLPSDERSEAFGVVLAEGAMLGRPLISTELGTGTSFVNIHEETGLVVQPNSPVALRKAMDRLYENKEYAVSLGENAKQRFEKLFTGRQMGQSYLELYKAVAAEPGTMG